MILKCYTCEKPLSELKITRSAKFCDRKCANEYGKAKDGTRQFQVDMPLKERRDRKKAFKDARNGCEEAKEYLRSKGVTSILVGGPYPTAEEAKKNMVRL